LVSGFATSGFAGVGLAVTFAAFDDALCACARPVAPHISKLIARTVAIARADITSLVPSTL
jgi:hypothetical protein